MPAPDDELLSKRLAGLPPVDGGEHGWQVVRQKLHRREQMAVRRRRAARVSLAASVTVLACLATFDVVQRRAEPDFVAPIAAAATPAAAEASELQQLRAQSIALEQVLAAMPDRPAVVRADSALPIDSLEAQVQWLDHRLSVGEGDAGSLEQAAQLWRERVEVMNSLVLLRYAEAQRVAM